MSIEKMIKEQVMMNDKNLEVALHIGNNIVDVKEALLEKLRNDIEIILKSENSDLKLDWQLKYWEKWSDFSFKKDGWKNYTICFCQDMTELNEVAYGISKVREDGPDISSIDKYFGPGEKSKGWPWYRYFEEPYR